MYVQYQVYYKFYSCLFYKEICKQIVQNFALECLALWFHIREVMVSRLFMETCCPG